MGMESLESIEIGAIRSIAKTWSTGSCKEEQISFPSTNMIRMANRESEAKSVDYVIHWIVEAKIKVTLLTRIVHEHVSQTKELARLVHSSAIGKEIYGSLKT